MKIKKILAIFAFCGIVMLQGCDKDEPNNLSVEINSNGSASGNVTYSRIDDDTFFLDYIKYKIVDSHLEVIGYDPVQKIINLRIYANVKIDGQSYETRVIAKEALAGLTVKTIELPNTIYEIEYNAFYSCRNLEKLSLPSSLEYIHGGAFSGCDSLKEMFVYAKMPPLIVHWEIYGIPLDNVVLYVPKSSIDDYMTNEHWRLFKNIKSMD